MATKTTWNPEELKAMSKKFDEWLRLTSNPVAVKLFANKKELDDVKDESGRPIRKVTEPRLTICQLIAQARYLGRTLAGDADALGMCTLATGAMGFKEVPLSYADGYVRAYFTDEKAARNTVARVPKFQPGSYVGMLASPLDRMPLTPDVVIFFGNTAQIYRFIQSYLYNTGGRMEFSSNAEAVCADLITLPMLTEKPQIGLPCNGGRVLSWPSDDEIAIGVPAVALEQVMNGMDFTHRGGVRYPTTWVHIGWEPPPGSMTRNIMEGKGFYPPEQRHPQKKK